MNFRILGPLEVHDGGQRLALGGVRQRTLLALLLLHANEVVSSDRLIDELWGEGRGDEGAKALQVGVSRLRKALEPGLRDGRGSEVLVTQPPGYELRVGSDELDLACFERLAAEGRQALEDGDPAGGAAKLRAALGLWRGPPLADLAYEPFAQPEIARLEELRLAALEDRIAADLKLGRHTELSAELRELVALHPLRERLHEQMMLALYRSGRQAEALDGYAAARRALVDELGIEPGRPLRELHEAVLRQDPELDLTARREPPTQVTHGAFVGRNSELAELQAGLESVLAGDGRLFLLAGEPGIGKSSLAEELAAAARARGARVLVGRCWEAGGAPAYWPWVQALRTHLRDIDSEQLRSEVKPADAQLATVLPELRELLPELPPAAAGDSEGARFRLFEAVAAFLRRAATDTPVALFLDDMHAADTSSLLLLRFVAAQLADVPILIVACYRDTEVGGDLAEALAEVTRQPGARRLALSGLGERETSRLLELTLGDAPPGNLSARVHTGTQGNPLFATEIARLLATEGSPYELKDRLPIPEGVREVVVRRLERQSESCREVLALASLMGREFDHEAVGRVGELGDEELLRALDEAVAARLVDKAPGAIGRMRFSHILVRDALYESLSPPRRVRLHRAFGEALEALYAGSPEPHLAELAHHFLEAGPSAAEKAVYFAHLAGNRAASQHGYDEAARHYSAALRVLEAAGPPDDELSCELLLSLGEVLSRTGSGQPAREALERAAALAERISRPDLLARAALEYGGRFAWARASSTPGLVSMLERALAAVGDEQSPARVKLLARLAGATRDDPSRERRVRLAHEALESAKRLGDPKTLAFATEGYYVAVEGPDMAGYGIEMGARLIALGEQIGDRERVFAGHDHRLHNFWWLGDRAGIDVELDASGAIAKELHQPAQRWHLGTGHTMLALMEGRFDDGEELIAETLTQGQRALSWNAGVSHRLALFVLRREQGRLAELEDVMRRSVHEYPALLRFRCALAHLYGELANEASAHDTFGELLSLDLENEHLDAEWLFSMSLLADPCTFLGDRAAAQKLYSLVLPYGHLYSQAPVEASFGSLARTLGVLATALDRFDDATRHFESAIEMERRMRAWPWLAHAQHDYARMLLRNQAADAEKAHRVLDDALAGYRKLGMDVWAERAATLLSR